jgi:transposase-like protein
MTHPEHNTEAAAIFETLIDKGLEGLPEVLASVINQAMKLERQRYLQAAPYERTEERLSHANGFKPKQLNTRIGPLNLSVPQTRDCEFYPSCLEQGMRSERALKMAIAEMYFQGVSTRKVKSIMQELCGFELTSTEVSRAAALLDDELNLWRKRKLGVYRYVYLDAIYEKIRYEGHVRDCAVLVAVGVNAKGYREIIGLSAELSEAEVHWRDFLLSLQNRGLQGVELFISDAHAGLKAARKTVFPSIPWQRCHFHLQQNAQAYVTKQSRKSEVAAVIRSILTASNESKAIELLNEAIRLFETDMPRLAQWMENNIVEALTHFQFPHEHHRRIRTSNLLERINKEIRRRTRVVGVFPNTQSCERLITAVLMEISQEWETGVRYLTF